LRGRVGRSKLRAYALFTLPAQQKITAQAERRLKCCSHWKPSAPDSKLASHDLDIRGAGNLLGEEQSGHIKEVGFELYQSMLEEAILNLKAGVSEPVADRWSPQITVGMPVLIRRSSWPTSRCGCRCTGGWPTSTPTTRSTISPPNCATALACCRRGALSVKIAAIKGYCRRANVEKVDAGPKGVVISFATTGSRQPDRLVYFIRQHGQAAKCGPT